MQTGNNIYVGLNIKFKKVCTPRIIQKSTIEKWKNRKFHTEKN